MKTKLHLLLMISMILLLVLSGCEDSPDVNPDGEAIPTGEVVDISGYTLIRSDTAVDGIVKAAVALRNSVEAKCGYQPKLSTDFVKRGDPVPADTAEIIIGDTNRHDSFVGKCGDWTVSREGCRVYLLGTTAEAVNSAVEYFTDNFLVEGGMNMVDGYSYSYNEKYDIERLTIGGTESEELPVYAAVNTDFSGLVDTIVARTGYVAPSAETVDDAKIIITDRTDLGIASGSWGVSVKDGRLYLVGSTQKMLSRAMNWVSEKLSASSGTLDFSDGVLISERVQTKEEFLAEKRLVIYPEFPENIGRSNDYEVSVTMDGETSSIPVYNHAMQNNVKGRSLGGDLYRRFSTFAFSAGEVRVDIKVKTDFDKYLVGPSAKAFRHEFKDGVISVWLDKPDYFYIMLDDDLNTMISVFADEPEYPEEIPDKGGDTVIYVEPGEWYEPEGGILDLKGDDYQIYVAPGGVLNARIIISGNNVKVNGNGAIVDPFENLYEHDISVGGKMASYFVFMRGENNTIDGLHMLDGRAWNLGLRGTGSQVKNLKILSTMMTSDGISLGSHTSAEHCFLYVGDNAIDWACEGSDAIHVKDITVGTTCKALFPQTGNATTSLDSLLEDIYVFRVGEEVISNSYNAGKKNITISFTIRGLDCTDCTYVPFFFTGRNMGTNPKNITLENVVLPATSGSTDPHNTTVAEDKRYHLRFFNVEGTDMETNNYTISINNLCIGGEIMNPDNIKILGSELGMYDLSITSSDDFKPTVKNEKTVNYKADDKVFIGERQIFFKSAPIKEVDYYLLPADELSEYLRAEIASIDTINNVGYVKSNSLSAYGTVKTAEDGSLVITPAYKGENLLLPDSGEISNFTEYTCWQVDLVVSEENGEYVYELKNIAAKSTGITRFITDEVRMYGAGKYTLSFDVKSESPGELSVIYYTDTTSKTTAIKATQEWKTLSVELDIKEDDADGFVSFMIFSTSATQSPFSLKDFKLVKN